MADTSARLSEMNEGLAIGPGATLLGIEVLLGGDQPEVGLPAVLTGLVVGP